jgi:hypothetical protein
MVQAIIRFYLFIVDWLRPVEAITRRRDRSRASQIEDTGRFYFKRNILDKLDDYFESIRKLRRWDPDSYAVYSRVGAQIVSPKMGSYHRVDDLDPKWRAGHRLGFGAVALLDDGLGEDGDEDRVPWKFGLIQKLDLPPANVEPVLSGTIYSVTSFSTTEGDRKAFSPDYMEWVNRFHVCVSTDGRSVRLLKERTSTRTVRPKHGRPFSVPCRLWGFPSGLAFVARENARKNAKGGRRFESAQEIAEFMFVWLVQSYEQASADIRVRVSDGSNVAAFCVDMVRTPYFFRDRDVSINVNGTRKKIFHVVRVHERRLRNGVSTFVRSHFRGERSFRWNGYQVLITMPGLHHRDLLDFDVGSYDQDAMKELGISDRGMIGMGAAGKAMDQAITRGMVQ